MGGALADPQRAEEFLGAVQRNAERLARLVNELLDLARIEAGEELELGRLTAEGAVGAVIDLLETRAHDKGIVLEVAVEDDLSFVGEARSLEQVLVNLVDNAINTLTRAAASASNSPRRTTRSRDLDPARACPSAPSRYSSVLSCRPCRSRDMGGTGIGLSIEAPGRGQQGTVGMRRARTARSVFLVRCRSPSPRQRALPSCSSLQAPAPRQ